MLALADIAEADYIPSDFSEIYIGHMGRSFEIPYSMRPFLEPYIPDCSQY